MPPEYTGGSRTTGEGGTGSRIERSLRAVDAFEAELWLLVVVTLALDVSLTYAGLQLGFAEGNPLLGPAMEQFGFVVLGVAKAGALGIAVVYRVLRPEYGGVIPLGLGLPWLVAVAVNAVHLGPLVLS